MTPSPGHVPTTTHGRHHPRPHLLHLVLVAVHDADPQHQLLRIVIIEDAVEVVPKAWDGTQDTGVAPRSPPHPASHPKALRAHPGPPKAPQDTPKALILTQDPLKVSMECGGLSRTPKSSLVPSMLTKDPPKAPQMPSRVTLDPPKGPPRSLRSPKRSPRCPPCSPRTPQRPPQRAPWTHQH